MSQFYQGLMIWIFAFFAMMFGPFELSMVFFGLCFLGSAMMFFAPDEDIDNDDMEKKEFILEDVINDTGPIKCAVEITDNICFIAEGYGDNCSQDGQGSSVMIENDEGILRVYIWDDINDMEPRVISLANARESLRK